MEALKEKLFARLREEGTVNEIRALLRRELVRQLHRVDPDRVVVREQGGNEEDLLASKFPLQAANWLLAEHLRRNKYEFTFSVFLLESGLDRRMHTFSIADVLTYLGLDSSSPFSRQIAADFADPESRQVLWTLLGHLVGRTTTAAAGFAKDDIPKSRRDVNNHPIHGEGDVLLRKDLKGRTFSNQRYPKDCDQLEDPEVIIKALPNWCSASVLEQQKLEMEDNLHQHRQVMLRDVATLQYDRAEWEQRRLLREKELQLEEQRIQQAKRDLQIGNERLSQLKQNHDEWLSLQKTEIVEEERRRFEEERRNLVDEEARLKLLLQSVQRREQLLNEREADHGRVTAELRNAKMQLAEAQAVLKSVHAQNLHLGQNTKAAVENERLRADLTNLKQGVRHVAQLRDLESSRRDVLIDELTTKLQKQHALICSLQNDLLQRDESHRNLKQRLSEDMDHMRHMETLLKKEQEELKPLVERLRLQQSQIAALRDTVSRLQAESNKIPSNLERHDFQGMTSVYNATVWNAECPVIDPGVDLHGTYFDTTLNATHLPVELKLGASESTTNTGIHHWVTNDSTLSELNAARARIRALELEADILEENCEAIRRRGRRTYRSVDASFLSDDREELPEVLDFRLKAGGVTDRLPVLNDLSSYLRLSSSTPTRECINESQFGSTWLPDGSAIAQVEQSFSGRWATEAVGRKLFFKDGQDARADGGAVGTTETPSAEIVSEPLAERVDNVLSQSDKALLKKAAAVNSSTLASGSLVCVNNSLNHGDVNLEQIVNETAVQDVVNSENDRLVMDVSSSRSRGEVDEGGASRGMTDFRSSSLRDFPIESINVERSHATIQTAQRPADDEMLPVTSFVVGDSSTFEQLEMNRINANLDTDVRVNLDDNWKNVETANEVNESGVVNVLDAVIVNSKIPSAIVADANESLKVSLKEGGDSEVAILKIGATSLHFKDDDEKSVGQISFEKESSASDNEQFEW